MALVIKIIRGRGYYYDQVSIYRPGRSPYSQMRYIGPVEPKRKRTGFFQWLREQNEKGPDDIAYAAMEKAELEARWKAIEPAVQQVAQILASLSVPQQPSTQEPNVEPSSSPSSEPSPQENVSGVDHTSDSGKV